MICHSVVYAAFIYLQEFLLCVLKYQLHVLLEMSLGLQLITISATVDFVIIQLVSFYTVFVL